MPETVLVTGARGFIGSAVCRQLRASGLMVFAHSRAGLPSVELSDVTPVGGDLRDGGEVTNLFRCLEDASHPVVVHLAAALPGVVGADAAAAENRAIDDGIIDHCGRLGIPLIAGSSVSVYERRGQANHTESEQLTPSDPYAREKLRTETRAHEVLASVGIPFAALRISSPYGPGHTNRTVLNLFLQRARAGAPLNIYGTGRREQDFIHVRDIATAALAVVHTRATGVFNVAAGQPTTMAQLAESIRDVRAPHQVEIAYTDQVDPEEDATARFSIERIRTATGWRPETSLRDGLRECIEAAE